LNQSSNSYFWRSSNFSLDLKNHSNIFELIQINSQKIQREFKTSV
jgi:hypothetical protein